MGSILVFVRPPISPSAAPHTPLPASAQQVRCVDVRHCTTRRLNAHRTPERRLLYSWHPWSGLSVHVHEVTKRGRGTALRCSLDGDAGRCLEVPAWMFEPEACVPLRLASGPQVGVGALSALQHLLAEVSSRSSMDASVLPAEGDFPDQNRGEVHATPPRPLPGDHKEPGCVFRRKPAADSDANQPLNPVQASHPFRRKPATPTGGGGGGLRAVVHLRQARSGKCAGESHARSETANAPSSRSPSPQARLRPE